MQPLSDTLLFQIIAARHRLGAIAQLEKLVPKRDALKQAHTENIQRRKKNEKEFEEQFQRQRTQ